jgi:hypothetical protein
VAVGTTTYTRGSGLFSRPGEISGLGGDLHTLEVADPLSTQDKMNLGVLFSIRDTIQVRAVETEETGPEEAAMDVWLVAHALDGKWAKFFSKRPFVRRKIRRNKPPSTQ